MKNSGENSVEIDDTIAVAIGTMILVSFNKAMGRNAKYYKFSLCVPWREL